MSEIAARSSGDWRNTMSINRSFSRYWPTVEPLNMVFDACAMAWLVTPSVRALAWSISSRITLTDSFQLSLTPRRLALSRSTALTSSALTRSCTGSAPSTRNCTG